MLVWRKLSSAKWEDAWMERLSCIDPQRIVISNFAGAKTIRIEAYDISPRDAKQLVKHFGGQVREMKRRDFVAEHAALRPPLRIRDKLLITRTHEEKEKLRAQFPRRHVLVIPAAMAFGTGEHATTATCLRWLCKLAAEFSAPWDLLDLGTGSGILALAAKMLGARRVDAGDFDPDCIRIARDNFDANGSAEIHLRQLDVTKWKPTRTWDLVSANLFSSVLIRAAPQISRALKPRGAFLFSGILREQERDCVRAFEREKMHVEQIIRKGKWVTGLARRRS